MKAILFDLDGVLVDSKSIHLKALEKMFKSKGINLTKEELRNSFGFTVDHNVEEICRKRGLSCPVKEWSDEKRQLALKMLKNSKFFPGTEDFLKKLNSYRLGLASSSTIEEVNTSLKHLKKYFDVITTREEVKKHKPAPDIYLLTAKKLNLKPEDCIVIEDSIAGVEAAKKAGMFCIAVLNSFPAKELKSADLVVKDLNDVRLKDLL